MTTSQQGKKVDRWLLAPVLVLLLLSIPLGVTLARGGFQLAEEFKSRTLIQFVSGNLNLKADNVEQAVEAELNQDVKIEQKVNLFQMELLSAVDNSSVNLLKSRLTELGMWDNSHSFTVDAFGPVFSTAQIQWVMVAAVGVLPTLALLALLLYRRRAAILSIPLVVGIDVIEILGVMALLNIPLGLPTLVGVLAVIMYSINSSTSIASRMLKAQGGWSKEQVRRTFKTGASMGVAALVLFVLLGLFTMNSQVIALAVVFLVGVWANLLNTWSIGAEVMSRWSKKPLEVGYNVSL